MLTGLTGQSGPHNLLRGYTSRLVFCLESCGSHRPLSPFSWRPVWTPGLCLCDLVSCSFRHL